MKIFVVTCTINIDSKDFDYVKRLCFDHDQCPNWNRGVESIELVGEPKANNGLGSKRQCLFYGGGSVYEVVELETESACGLYITDDSQGKPGILKNIGIILKAEKIDEKTTKLTSQAFFLPKAMPLTYCLAATALKKAMGETAWYHAAGIKHYCDTGEVVTNKTDLGKVGEYDFEYTEKPTHASA